jgi:DNA-binding transcriptional ArsR family regulator
MAQHANHEDVIRLFRDNIPLFQALSDPARQDIILLLAEHEALNVSDIASHSRLSRPAISHHLKILRDVGLVKPTQQGTQRYYSLSLEMPLLSLKKLIEAIETTCL